MLPWMVTSPITLAWSICFTGSWLWTSMVGIWFCLRVVSVGFWMWVVSGGWCLYLTVPAAWNALHHLLPLSWFTRKTTDGFWNWFISSWPLHLLNLTNRWREREIRLETWTVKTSRHFLFRPISFLRWVSGCLSTARLHGNLGGCDWSSETGRCHNDQEHLRSRWTQHLYLHFLFDTDR